MILSLRLLDYWLIYLDLGLGINNKTEFHCLWPWKSCRMLSLLLWKQLARCLSVVINLFLETLFLKRVAHCVKVHSVLIRNSWESIKTFLSLLIFLFVPEYVVNPSVEVLRDILRLKCLSHVYHEEVGVVLAPRRQLDIVNYLSILFLSKVDSIMVDKELRTIEELGDQLSHVGMVVECRVDGVLQRVETSIWRVQLFSMQLNQALKIRSYPTEVV